MNNTYYLRHAKGEERKKHKYIMRIPIKNAKKTGPQYRYFYTLAEWRAYQKDKKKAEDKLKNEQKKAEEVKPKKELTNEKKTLSPTSNSEAAKKIVDKYLTNNGSKKTTELSGVGDKVKSFVSDVLKYGLAMTVADRVYTWLDENTNKVSVDTDDQDKETDEKASKRAREKAEREKLVADAEDFKHVEAPDSFDDLNRLDSDIPNDLDREAINPYYTTDTPFDNDEYTTNCSYCTAAYDLRQRGYDVQAAAISPEDDPTTIDELISWYDGAENQELFDVISNHEDIYKEAVNTGYITAEMATEAFTQDMLEQGEGARGFLCLYWAGGGGHAVAWEVENGEVVVRDCQTNQTVDMIDYIQLCEDVNYFRTDNVEPNEEILKTVRNRRERD